MSKKEEKRKMIYRFIYNILTSNIVMNRYDCSIYGNIVENKTIGLYECINFIGRMVAKNERRNAKNI